MPDFSPAEKDETFDLGKLLLTVQPGLEIGQEAPDFAVKSLQNQSFALANLRGKYLLLYFWSSWTIGGHAEIEQAYAEYRDDPGLVILGMNVNDTLDEVREHVRNEAVGWPVVHLGNREDSTLIQDYHAVIPSYIVIGPGGKIRAADYFGGDRLETALASLLGK